MQQDSRESLLEVLIHPNAAQTRTSVQARGQQFWHLVLFSFQSQRPRSQDSRCHQFHHAPASAVRTNRGRRADSSRPELTGNDLDRTRTASGRGRPASCVFRDAKQQSIYDVIIKGSVVASKRATSVVSGMRFERSLRQTDQHMCVSTPRVPALSFLPPDKNHSC